MWIYIYIYIYIYIHTYIYDVGVDNKSIYMYICTDPAFNIIMPDIYYMNDIKKPNMKISDYSLSWECVNDFTIYKFI